MDPESYYFKTEMNLFYAKGINAVTVIMKPVRITRIEVTTCEVVKKHKNAIMAL